MPSTRVTRRAGLPRRIHPVWLGLAAASNAVICKTAQAQLLDRYYPANIGAYQDWGAAANGAQIDEGYAPLGIRLGNFIISPTADAAIAYETDPLAGANGKATASETLQTDAAIGANSNWARNSVGAYLSVNNTRYLTLGRSITDWTAAAGGRVLVGEDVIDLGYVHINAVSLPTDVGAFAQPRTVAEQNDDLRASYTIGVGRISLEPSLQGDIYTFGLLGGGALPGNNGLFDRDALTASLTANYQFAGGHNLVAILSDSVLQYSGGQSPLRPADYTDASFLVGIEYKTSALLAYRALVGYEERIPTGRGTTDSTHGAPAAELDVIYKPTVLTTLTGKVSQTFENSPTDSGQGLTETSLQLTLEHSLSRRVQLHASAQLIRATFANDGGSALEVSTTARADMHLSRHIVVSAEYDFSEASGGNAQSISYRNHEIILRGRLQW